MAAYSTITDVDEELEVETSAKKVSVVTAVAVGLTSPKFLLTPKALPLNQKRSGT